ncbi:hypothetical protein [Nonomuraea rhodomycinica]|uniref:t-SNARE coiled-coil homology domain-containing protein n=1 Tax=Nonomuraea rhodomycinica TaxID=1712872 RepID=A0A7Y6ITB1_9ACTN|nr:hypothetical protein [Nonomuraea rhodomycinica]NUW44017.1 hypothetical protein [Nonomuraea rhodomycinica]
MVDLQMEVEDLKLRVKALEAHTMNGMGDMTVAERFGSLHDRVDMVGDNILTKMGTGFQNVNRRLDLIDLRLGPVEDRLRLMGDRFESIDLRFDAMDRKFEAIDQRFETMDQRFDTMDQRFDTMDQRFDTMDQRLGRVESDMTDIKAMLLSLGAKAPEQN